MRRSIPWLLGLALLIGLLGSADALAEEEAGMLVEPNVVTFTKLKEKKQVTIKNAGGVAIKNIKVATEKEADFKALELCKGKELKPKGQKGDSCVEEVEVLVLGKVGSFASWSIEPIVGAEIELKS